MTPDQILLVQTSFEMMGADGTALASTLRARPAICELARRGRLTGHAAARRARASPIRHGPSPFRRIFP